MRRCHTVHHITQSRSLSATTACCATQQRVSYPSCRKFPVSSGVTSHRQPRQCRGEQGPKTVKGPKVTRIMYQDCYLTVYRYFTKSSPLPTYFTFPDRSLFTRIIPKFFFLILWFRSYSDVIIDGIARSECLLGGGKNYSYATAGEFR